MKNRLLTILIIGFIFLSFNTSKNYPYKGVVYELATDQYYPLNYSKSYSQNGDTFITTYKITHPAKGYHFYDVVAKHCKSDSVVDVFVEQAGGGWLANRNKETTKYGAENLVYNKLGFPGAAKLLGGNRVPNQLFLKFISKKYEHVKVINILADYRAETMFWFVLDDE